MELTALPPGVLSLKTGLLEGPCLLEGLCLLEGMGRRRTGQVNG
jgi:hypothetical protein